MGRRSLERELTRYEDIFAARRLSIPDEDAIRRLMKNRHPHLQPKKKGDLNILAIYHHYTWENDSLKPALERFGRVRHYDWFERFNHQRKNWHVKLKQEMNADLVEKVRQWVRTDGTDLIFTYLSGEIVFPETMQAIAELKIPSVNIAFNDKEHFVGKIRGGQAIGNRDICRWFDICWTSTEDALKKYCVEGATPVYLPEAANPDIHHPYDESRTIDVSFVGQCYGNRPAVISRLRDHGIRAEACGYGWPDGPLSTEEMVRLYSRSRINLGFGGVIDHAGAFCLKGRDFEIPMSGGLYLTEDHPELWNVYEIGKEIVTYTGFDDMLEKIGFLLSNPEAAESIRQRGRSRALKDHTWEMRFNKVFSLLGILK